MSEKKYNNGGQIDFMSLINQGLQSQINPEVLAKQRRQQGVISGVAGIADTISGGIGQRQAEGDIETFGAEADAIRQQMRDMKAPSIMSPENQAAAVRNATILGAGKPQEDSSELAAAKMAMDAGADPANIQRALTEAEAQKDATARAEQQGAFREGLGYAHQDAMSGYQKDMQDLGMDYDENQRALEMAQNQSLMAQQQKQQGFGNLAAGATKFLSSGGVDAIKGLFGGKKGVQFADNTQGVDFNSAFSGGSTGMFGAKDTPFGTGGLEGAPKLFDGSVQGQGLDQDQKFNMLRGPDLTGVGVMSNKNQLQRRSNLEDIFDYKPYRESEDFQEPFSMDQFYGDAGTSSLNPYTYAQGGAVQATPGAFNHDNGDGEFQTGENEILGFAQTANGLEDTGIRMTGGEFVINPDQAKGMEKAYDRVKKKKNPSRADLMALYEAVRFIDEPQFD